MTAPAQEKDKPLPQLRRDIKIYKGPAEADGSPTFNCLDPVKAVYYKISWAEMAILQHLKPGMTLTELTKKLNEDTTLRVKPEEVVSFFEEAAQNNLLVSNRSAETFLAEQKKRKMHPILWVLYHYLYIRIPILNPDAFLGRTLHYVRPLVATPAWIFYAILTLSGLFFLVNRFSEFLGTFPYFFNFEGLLIYGIAISAVKVIHEFSHAYVAKFYRLHVPTMGIALIVLWPVLYTDVTDGWKLSRRSQRLAITIAGVVAELILAGISTLGWAFSEPGLLQSVFFVIASTTWISTLFVNLNPAMRFDGYYLFSDLIGVDNLQQRGFAYTRWQIRKWLFGLDVPPPEAGFSLRRRILLFGYSVYTWIYRLVLYTAIAIFVYYEFTKALGILLFLVEIAFFIAPPFVSEGRQLMRLAPYFTLNVRSITTITLCTLFIFWFVFPWPHRERFPALSVVSENQMIYIPQEGSVESINFALGDQIVPDKVLIQLKSDPLDYEIAQTKADIEAVQAQIRVFSVEDKNRPFLPEKAAELASAQAKLKTLLKQKDLLTVKSKISGTIYEKDETIRPGDFLHKNQMIGQLGTLNRIEIVAYVPENKLEYIQKGQRAWFRITNSLMSFNGRITKITPVRSNQLIYPQLSSTNHGDLPVVPTDQGKNLVIVESYFLVRVEIENQDPSLVAGEKGYLTIYGPWRSLLVQSIRYLQSLYLRESGF